MRQLEQHSKNVLGRISLFVVRFRCALSRQTKGRAKMERTGRVGIIYKLTRDPGIQIDQIPLEFGSFASVNTAYQRVPRPRHLLRDDQYPILPPRLFDQHIWGISRKHLRPLLLVVPVVHFHRNERICGRHHQEVLRALLAQFQF